MARHQGPVLVDTNVILECHRTDSWRALTNGYQVETVEDCVTETQTGFPQRREDQQIDPLKLRESLAAVHETSQDDWTELIILLQTSDIALDQGEKSLWAHACQRIDEWVLCGPDGASLRCGIRLGLSERLVPLENLLEDVGHRPRSRLREEFTRSWHNGTVNRLAMNEWIETR